MDSLTHIVLGACIGKIILPQKMGKKALVLGALANSIPDIDAISTFFNSETQDLLLHRSITHSLFIAIIFALLFSSFSFIREKKKRTYKFARLFFSFLVLVVLHDLLDTCNNYGTELFAPFSSTRYSFHLLYVVDPLFTLIPLIATIVLFVKKSNWEKGLLWARMGVLLPCMYLLGVGIVKAKVMHTLATTPPTADAKFDILTPAPFNSLLWYGVFSTDSNVYTTYRSVFDTPKRKIEYSSYPKNDSILHKFSKDEDAQNLLEFSGGIYTLERHGDSTLFCIPRFGEILGWQFPQAPFTFYYYLAPDIDNSMTMQRGRLKGWNKATTHYYINRMLGK